MTREELLKSPEYWTLEIQMDLYKVISDFMVSKKLNRKQLADKFGFSKGYISQILNGEFDHRISKLVELALAVGKVPVIQFEEIDQILIDDLYDSDKKTKSERPVVKLQINPIAGITLSESIQNSKKSDFKFDITTSFNINKKGIYEEEKFQV